MNFSFPLYDNLNINDLPIHEMTSAEKDGLVELVESLDEDGRERVFVLIKKFYSQQGEGNVRIPYNGKQVKKDIKFDLSEMPNKLRHMLHKFVVMHHKTMSEDKERLSNRSS